MKRLVLILTTLALVLPGSAGAHHRHRIHANPNPITVAYADALRYWHATPCNGNVQITYGPIPANSEHSSEVGDWSSWDPGTLEQNSESAPQPFSGCVIGINSAVWTSTEYMAFTAWAEFSAAIIHEVGHLLGHVHSTDPANVMYPEPAPQLWLTGDTAPGWH